MFPNDVPKNVRALFLSDLHLGYRLSKADRCIEVLNYFQAEQIYLVGDTIDVSRMSKIWFWPDEHQQVIDKICDLQNRGTEIFVAPGNHDQCFRYQNYFAELRSRYRQRLQLLVEPLMNLNVDEAFTYTARSGKQLLITHGDLVDTVNARFYGIPKLGSRIFDRISWLFPDRLTHLLRNSFKFILARPAKIESAVIEQARQQQFQGVIFGHLHRPSLSMVNGIIVGNTGDWMENQSLMVETLDGQLLLINFGDVISEVEV